MLGILSNRTLDVAHPALFKAGFVVLAVSLPLVVLAGRHWARRIGVAAMCMATAAMWLCIDANFGEGPHIIDFERSNHAVVASDLLALAPMALALIEGVLLVRDVRKRRRTRASVGDARSSVAAT